jgi:hypothetical protein
MVGRCLLWEVPSREGYPKKSLLRKMQIMDNMVEHYQRSQKAAQDIQNGNNKDETLCDVQIIYDVEVQFQGVRAAEKHVPGKVLTKEFWCCTQSTSKLGQTHHASPASTKDSRNCSLQVAGCPCVQSMGSVGSWRQADESSLHNHIEDGKQEEKCHVVPSLGVFETHLLRAASKARCREEISTKNAACKPVQGLGCVDALVFKVLRV